MKTNTKTPPANTKEVLAGGITPQQLNNWKSQFPEIKIVVIPLGDEEDAPIATGYFKKPDLELISMASKQDDAIDTGKVLFNDCFLGGDPEFQNNGEVKMSAMHALIKMFKVRTAVIKNA